MSDHITPSHTIPDEVVGAVAAIDRAALCAGTGGVDEQERAAGVVALARRRIRAERRGALPHIDCAIDASNARHMDCRSRPSRWTAAHRLRMAVWRAGCRRGCCKGHTRTPIIHARQRQGPHIHELRGGIRLAARLARHCTAVDQSAWVVCVAHHMSYRDQWRVRTRACMTQTGPIPGCRTPASAADHATPPHQTCPPAR